MDPIRIKQLKRLPKELAGEVPERKKRLLNNPEVLLFIATIAGQSVGYLIGSVEPATLSGEVEAIAVLPAFRQHGVGAKLLEAFEKTLVVKHCVVAIKRYEASDPEVSAIESLFKKSGWKTPQLFIRRYHFSVQHFHPAWFERNYALPADFTIFPWCELRNEERERLRHQLAEGTFPSTIYPLGIDADLTEPINSLGLRHNDVLIGWMVTHRTAPDTICYAYYYLQDDYRHRIFGIRLLSDAIRLQQQSSVPHSTFEIRQGRSEPGWERFVKKRLAPYAKSTSDVRMVWKDLRKVPL